mmetsp:Transcript_4161/g.7047  ORF Transcript_4161/g.7047 Transcript_4161/m.7047 type:complete len:121 (-) Transcript_4161:42-404(-)
MRGNFKLEDGFMNWFYFNFTPSATKVFTSLVLSPLYLFTSKDEADQVYNQLEGSIETLNQDTSLAVTIPFAFMFFVISAPVEMLLGVGFLTLTGIETFFVQAESFITGKDPVAIVDHLNH